MAQVRLQTALRDAEALGAEDQSQARQRLYREEGPAIEVDTSLNGLRVARVLDRLAETHGLPEVLRTENGV